MTHPDVAKVHEKLSECTYQSICSEYESSINTLVSYGLLDKAHTAAHSYKKFLDDERALHNRMDALKTQRYLFGFVGFVIGIVIGLFVMSKRNKEGEDKW